MRVYAHTMKKPTNLTLSLFAKKILQTKENATAYVEELILMDHERSLRERAERAETELEKIKIAAGKI